MGKLLAYTQYDPPTVASLSTASLLAMTAMDTANLRLSFVAASRSVYVRIRVTMGGATTSSQVLLGILDHTNGDVVKARQAPLTGRGGAAANATTIASAVIAITGLTPGQTYTYDAAYDVEFAVAATALKYGGPNNTTQNDAFGSIAYEIWDAPELLDSKHYDPAVAVSNSVATATAMTALDTTNLRCTFVGPASGIVHVRLRGVTSDTTGGLANTLLGILDGATVKMRNRGFGGINDVGSLAATSQFVAEATGIIAVTPGLTYNWDAAYGVDGQQVGGNLHYGGPNDTTQANAWGGFSFDVSDAAPPDVQPIIRRRRF